MRSFCQQTQKSYLGPAPETVDLKRAPQVINQLFGNVVAADNQAFIYVPAAFFPGVSQHSA